jgi:hypothetical protein
MCLGKQGRQNWMKYGMVMVAFSSGHERNNFNFSKFKKIAYFTGAQSLKF